MDEPGDRPLERITPEDDTLPPARRLSSGTLILIAAVGLAIGAAAAWWWARSRDIDPPAAAAAAPPPSDAAPASVTDPAASLPPLGQMDTFLRALFGALSSHPDLVRWLATNDLIHQLANGIDRASRGQSPARDLPTLRPTDDFGVTRRGSAATIDPASYRRYDRFASLVQSLDPEAVAEVYRTIEPRLNEAYRGLGRAEGDVATAVDAALRLLIDTPIPTEPLRVVPGQGANFAFADPRYEQLLPIQKQLLRMGPENAQRIQARLREIRRAIDSPP